MVIQHGLYSGFFRNSNKIEFGNIKKCCTSDTALAEAFYSPARFTPVVGVTPGTRYRTSIQELLHPRSYFRTMRYILQFARYL